MNGTPSVAAAWLAGADPLLTELAADLRRGLTRYWQMAGEILAGGPIQLLPLAEDRLGVERHFFSALFLYALHRSGLPPEQRVFAVAVNQCLRGLVTGCDNLLDDEYKPTLETDLPLGSTRFRSVVDLLVSDRVLFALLLQRAREEGLTQAQVLAASAASLATLTPSGVQEAGEEATGASILAPEAVLTQVHHAKTGLLFQCAWAVPEALGDLQPPRTAPFKQAIYRIGMGCQLLDDLVDWPDDARRGRQNYLSALVTHQGSAADQLRLRQQLAAGSPAAAGDWLAAFPAARRQTLRLALAELRGGLAELIEPRHAALAAPAITFLLRRIGGVTIAPFIAEALV